MEQVTPTIEGTNHLMILDDRTTNSRRHGQYILPTIYF